MLTATRQITMVFENTAKSSQNTLLNHLNYKINAFPLNKELELRWVQVKQKKQII